MNPSQAVSDLAEPGEAPILRVDGADLWEAGQAEASLPALQRAIELWPTWRLASLWLSHALRDVGQVEAARAEAVAGAVQEEATVRALTYCDFYTLDENLVIGPVPGVEGFLVAVGFSGHGMQQSPAVGRALYELIAFGEYRAIDLARFGHARVETGEGVHESNCW